MERTLPHIIVSYICDTIGEPMKVYDKITGVNKYDLYAPYSEKTEMDYLHTEIMSIREFSRIDLDKYYIIDKGKLGRIYEYKANNMLVFQIAKKEKAKLLRLLEVLKKQSAKEELTAAEKKIAAYHPKKQFYQFEIEREIKYIDDCVRLTKEKTYYRNS